MIKKVKSLFFNHFNPFKHLDTCNGKMDWLSRVRALKNLKEIFYDSEKADKQTYCDQQLKKLPCKDVVINYLLCSREHARQQKKELSESNLLEFFNVGDKINKDNDKILDELYKTINMEDKLEVCKKLNKINFK